MRRRRAHEIASEREARNAAGALGGELRRTRRRRRLTQAQLGERVGLGQTRIHELESGQGASAPLSVWFAIGAALGRPISVGFSRDLEVAGDPADAGHLAAQEIVLRLARSQRRTGMFELPTRPSARAGGSVDVGIRDDPHRAFVLVEIWNRTGDLGSASRSTTRKLAEATELAAFRGYRVASCWLFVDNATNRALVRRFPEVLRSQFTGSSVAWVQCLTEGTAPPERPGIAWIDARSGRITSMRLGAVR